MVVSGRGGIAPSACLPLLLHHILSFAPPLTAKIPSHPLPPTHSFHPVPLADRSNTQPNSNNIQAADVPVSWIKADPRRKRLSGALSEINKCITAEDSKRDARKTFNDRKFDLSRNCRLLAIKGVKSAKLHDCGSHFNEDEWCVGVGVQVW